MALPYRGEGEPISLLMLAGSAGGNIPLRRLLDDRVFRTFVVFAEYYDDAIPLPPHSVVFNAIGDADLAAVPSPPPVPCWRSRLHRSLMRRTALRQPEETT